MSYETKSEKQPLQMTANDFKSLASVPGVVWIIGVLLLLCLSGTIPVWLGVTGSIAAVIVDKQMAKAAELQEAKSRAAAYANMIGPIVVGSDNPEENVYLVHEKAKAWREKLKLSGNPYADKLPIIEYPYSPMIYSVGQLSAGWSIYCKELAERQHRANLEWYDGKCPDDLKALFASAVLPPIKQPEQ